MIYSKQICCTFLLLVVTLVSMGQKRPISLSALVKRVVHFSPELSTDSASVVISEARLAEAKTNILPNFRVGYQTNLGSNNNVAGPYMAFGVVPSNSRGVRPNSTTKAALTNLGIASLDWELYNFGGYAAERKAAKSALNVEQANYAQNSYELRALSIDHYLNLLKYQELLTIQKQAISRTEQIERSIRALAKSGVKAGVDTSIAGAELSKAKLNFIDLNNTFSRIQLELAAISGLQPTSIIADTNMLSKLSNLEMKLLFTRNDSLQHPLLASYKNSYQASLDQERVVQTSFNPKINFQASVWSRGSSIDANDNFNPLWTGLEWQRGNYMVGIGITYNLFDIGRQHVKLNTQKATSQYHLKMLEQQKTLLSNAIAVANQELYTAHQRLAEIPTQLKAAKAGYRQKLSLYKNGLTNIVELNTALSMLFRAETDHVEARYRYMHALFQRAITTNQLDTILTLLK